MLPQRRHSRPKAESATSVAGLRVSASQPARAVAVLRPETLAATFGCGQRLLRVLRAQPRERDPGWVPEMYMCVDHEIRRMFQRLISEIRPR